MSEFSMFSSRVHAQYQRMTKNELFCVGNPDELWAEYLRAFPEGTNPIYKTRTEHDCSCCRSFIRTLGRVVSVVDGKVSTVWDITGAPYPYDEVAAHMSKWVHSQPIEGLFRTTEGAYGAESTKQLLEDQTVKTWNHFHGKIAAKHRSSQPGPAIGNYDAAVQVFRRSLTELTPTALKDISDLIAGKSLYRGEEFAQSVSAFMTLQSKYFELESEQARELFVWEHAKEPGSRFRNTAIGTLAVDLSAGEDLEKAVRSFEAKVAPTNYKRPTALITPAMVTKAMGTIRELGLEEALQRRFARIEDVSVNNVLWVDGKVKPLMKDSIKDALMAVAKAPVKLEAAKTILVEEFMSEVLPKAVSMELFVSNQHLPNFVSLTAPASESPAKLFKWNNPFGWSYDGNITDSIKEKVKRAGGNVTNARLRTSLAWFNYDDLDIHVHEPDGTHIYFASRHGKLDVDMNAGGRHTRQPVENVSWVHLKNGLHKVTVNQFSQRESTDVGFVVEIEYGGRVIQLSYPKALKGHMLVATIMVKGGQVVEVTPAPGMIGGGISQEKWGVKTENFVKVETLMYSPNHWDGQSVGNKHHLFILEGCRNPDPARGIYNEFLTSELDVHRKVFEVLGDKTKCQPTADQLSGLGFSSTRGDTVHVRVDTEVSTRVYEVKF